MRLQPSGSSSGLKQSGNRVVEIRFKKSDIEDRQHNLFPFLLACATGYPGASADDNFRFKFHFDDWDNVVRHVMDDYAIAYEMTQNIEQPGARSKGLLFKWQ